MHEGCSLVHFSFRFRQLSHDGTLESEADLADSMPSMGVAENGWVMRGKFRPGHGASDFLCQKFALSHFLHKLMTIESW